MSTLKKLLKKDLIVVHGYMIDLYKCPYCGLVFSYEGAVKDRDACHRRFVGRYKYRKKHPKKKRWWPA